jgi:EAL domain-containing protein (putative c-di-GMP-specific phosphodiesterase class I)
VTEAASHVAVESSIRVSELASHQAAQLRETPMVRELQRALDKEELRLHYQAMFDITSGAVVGMEALLRWQHPTRGLLFPSEFLEVAEGPHLVLPIGDWVLRTAVAQAARWRRMLGDEVPILWANISCDQLGRQHLPDLVGGQLSEAGLPAGSLGIEVTERQLAGRMDDVNADLRELRSLGVVLAVDDFGTGYASLDYLRRFRFDEIKIDGSFVSGIGQDRTDTAVTASIVTLGRSLGLTVVGEGVETREQLTRLGGLGCSVAQGYLLHRPSPAEQGSELLLAGAHPHMDQPSG